MIILNYENKLNYEEKFNKYHILKFNNVELNIFFILLIIYENNYFWNI